MEQKTPARGTNFWRLRSGAPADAPIPVLPTGKNRDRIHFARELAARTASIIPEGFTGVLPRGYTLLGQSLVLARFEMQGARGQALYGRHNQWGEREAHVFLRDLNDGWLTELSAYMRWQLRADPFANAIFQHALVHLHHDVTQRMRD